MFFNSATRHLFETLRIDLENCETASVVKLEKEDKGRTNEEIVQELQRMPTLILVMTKRSQTRVELQLMN